LPHLAPSAVAQHAKGSQIAMAQFASRCADVVKGPIAATASGNI
jgi:hypothetical protein